MGAEHGCNRRLEMTSTYMMSNMPTGDLTERGKSNSSRGAAVSAIPCRIFAAKTHPQRYVKRLLTGAAPIMALCTLAVVAFATPASAYEYCSRDTSGILGCAYDSMEQCHAS